jgi:hypothetical protein
MHLPMDPYRCAFLAALALLIATPASAQTFDGQVEWDLSLWPKAQQRYWHNAKLDLEGGLRWSWMRASIRGRLQAWGASPSKFDDSQPSPLVAEFIRTIERHQGALVAARVGKWSVGVQLRRRAVHHVWRHRNAFGRHDYFPVGGNWKEGRKQCTDDDQTPVAKWTNGDCPSIGYSERLGVRLANVEGKVTGYVSVLPIQYKTNTLPPSIAVWGAEAELSPRWHVKAQGSVEVTGLPYGTAQVKRKVLRGFWVGFKFGRERDPGWRRGFWTASFTIGSR